MTNAERKIYLKNIWISRVVNKTCTGIQAAHALNIRPETVTRLKNKYILANRNKECFVHKSKNRTAHNRTPEALENKIIEIYYRDWYGCPYSTFQNALEHYEHISISYITLRKILKRHNIKPMKNILPKDKPVHESRIERPSEGDLIQMDASKHDWFMNGTYANLHGGIDDATHQITGLYFCLNECRLGYNEVLRQTFLNYGIPGAVYIDRHSSFVSAPHRRKESRAFTLEEKLQNEKNSNTHFTDLCNELNIEVILALSAQGKGRIERLWQTLQGKLPFYFRKEGIKDCQSANLFIQKWLPQFNEKFKHIARNSVTSWKTSPNKDRLSYLLSVKENHRTNSRGEFIFHDYQFSLKAERKANKNFVLCLSEEYGIKAYMNGKYYDVELEEPLCDVVGQHMTIVERDLISRYLENDLRKVWSV